MNLDQFSQLFGGDDHITCCACSRRINPGEKYYQDESGWLCAECGEGEPQYAAVRCYCEECSVIFETAWQIPMNAKKVVPPNMLTCTKCGKRTGKVLHPIEYYGGLPIEGETDPIEETDLPFQTVELNATRRCPHCDEPLTMRYPFENHPDRAWFCPKCEYEIPCPWEYDDDD